MPPRVFQPTPTSSLYAQSGRPFENSGIAFTGKTSTGYSVLFTMNEMLMPQLVTLRNFAPPSQTVTKAHLSYKRWERNNLQTIQGISHLGLPELVWVECSSHPRLMLMAFATCPLRP